ncbi:MAG: glucose-6-phosphate isomerase [Cryomorphaceae bacterium]
MIPKIDPTKTAAWQALKAHFDDVCEVHMNDLFQSDPNRFERFSMVERNVFMDFSKHRITEDTLDLLQALATECHVKEGIQAMFNGELLNETEGRAVLHTALRNTTDRPVYLKSVDVMTDVRRVKAKMRAFSERVIAGDHRGFTGKTIASIVNIGIGGSDLGPCMVVEALKHYGNHLDVRFASNVDANHIVEVCKDLDPETTLFVIASKTFTTQETMTNAHSARAWLVDSIGSEDCVKNHVVAVSTNQEAAVDFGIDPENLFEFWDWVGGRFSLWGAVGLSIMLAIGPDRFEQLLEGAELVDQQVKDKGTLSMPGILALLSLWYGNFFHAETHAILPYDQYLHRLPAFLQQADMESNGKSVDRNGNKIAYQTGAVIWGEPGTNGQHAFYQLIHQGTALIPSDFIAFAVPLHRLSDHHDKLLANCFAQSMAMMQGKSAEAVKSEMRKEGSTEEEMNRLHPYRTFEGNIPSTTLLIEKLTPRSLGQLIAIYEHKILIEGLILNVYSFDQWGVELGKQLAKPILSEIAGSEDSTSMDQSTKGLLRILRNFKLDAT